MADVKKDSAADAGGGKSLDKLLKGLDALDAKLDSMGSRMDAFEAKFGKMAKKDDDAPPAPPPDGKAPPPPGDGEPVPVAADRKKKAEAEQDAAPPPPPGGEPPPPPPPPVAKGDAEPPPPPPPPGDKDKEAALDSAGVAALAKRLDRMERLMPKERSDHDLATDQARLDSVMSLWGKQAPRPLIGDTRTSYTLRHLEDLKQHSPQWKAVDLGVIAVDEKALDVVRDQIYAAASDAARNPASAPLGTLRPIVTRRESGHLETRFIGSPSAWMNRYAPTGRAVTKINLKKD